jgi:hypothetical protein
MWSTQRNGQPAEQEQKCGTQPQGSQQYRSPGERALWCTAVVEGSLRFGDHRGR